jgi:hypothetical protein
MQAGLMAEDFTRRICILTPFNDSTIPASLICCAVALPLPFQLQVVALITFALSDAKIKPSVRDSLFAKRAIVSVIARSVLSLEFSTQRVSLFSLPVNGDAELMKQSARSNKFWSARYLLRQKAFCP